MTSKLQQLCGKWHKQKFPLATNIEVALKAAEEMGEVAQEVLGDSSNNSFPERGGHTPEEAADVAITLFVLLERFYPGRDLLKEVQKKMDIMTDPTSGHRAAIYIRSEMELPF